MKIFRLASGSVRLQHFLLAGKGKIPEISLSGKHSLLHADVPTAYSLKSKVRFYYVLFPTVQCDCVGLLAPWRRDRSRGAGLAGRLGAAQRAGKKSNECD